MKKQSRLFLIIILVLVCFTSVSGMGGAPRVRITRPFASIWIGNGQPIATGPIKAGTPAVGLVAQRYFYALQLGIVGLQFYPRAPLGIGLYNHKFMIYKGLFARNIFSGPIAPELHIQLLPFLTFQSRIQGVKLLVLSIGIKT